MKGRTIKKKETMSDIQTEVDAKILLGMEAARINDINRAKRKPIIQYNITSCCVPNIKIPTAWQMMELIYGEEIVKARREAMEKHDKKVKESKEAVLINLNNK